MEARSIDGDGTLGLVKKYANTITFGTAFPTELAAYEQKGVVNQLRGLVGGDDPIVNAADIDAYEQTPLFNSEEWTHGDVFTASEVGVALASLPQLIKSVPDLISSIRGAGSGAVALVQRQDELLDSLKPLKSPAREILENEGQLIGVKEGLQSQKYGMFEDVVTSQHPDPDTKYLWTMDDRGVNVAMESTPFPTPRGNIVHTNLSDRASVGGEAWFGEASTVTINADSGRFGYSISKESGVTEGQWKAVNEYWDNLGYDVTSIPLGER